jgi:membrane-associated phospholipid phosphatase
MSEFELMGLPRRIIDSFAVAWTRPRSLSESSGLPRRIVLANRIELAKRRIQSNIDLDFHTRMAYGSLSVLLVSFIGCKLTSIHTSVSGRVTAIIVMFAMVAPLPIYWHEKGRTALREAALVLPWELLLSAILSFPVLIAARLRMPLQDSLFGRLDQFMGVSVPHIVAWADHHLLGTVINRSYPWLLPFLAVAGFAPPLLGKVKNAREFLVGNLVAFAIGVPLFALLPAIGPWSYYHLTPNPAQELCSSQLLSLRVPGPYLFQEQAAGVVCFPSFHVVWAILCAVALWGFRPIRIPIALLSTMIIASTLTTGWHYFSDVLGGIAVAAIAIAISRAYSAISEGVNTSS